MAKETTTTVSEAGRKGGMTVLEKHGLAHFSKIGARGQAAMREKHPGKASDWGKLGGRPKKLPLNKIMGEEGK